MRNPSESSAHPTVNASISFRDSCAPRLKVLQKRLHHAIEVFASKHFSVLLNATPERVKPRLEQRMRNKFFAVLGVAATLTLAACSSSDETKPGSKANASSGANAPVAASSSNSGNSNTNAVTEGAAVIPQTGADLAQTDVPTAGIQSPQMQTRLSKLQKDGGPSGPPVDAAALAMKLARPAPDNSTFTSYLSDAGYEIRTFKSHAQLKKVEKITASNGSVTIKVFLRNGKVIDLPGQAIPILSTAPASQIMDAAGLSTPAPPSQPDPRKPKQ